MKLDIRNEQDARQARHAKAYLNGALVPTCVMADEEAGVVEYYETNAQGHIIADDHGAPRVIRETGIVRIERGQ
jgi:hypothetical protein